MATFLYGAASPDFAELPARWTRVPTIRTLTACPTAGRSSAVWIPPVWDALNGDDADGLDLDQSGDMNLERLWTNLKEFRYVKFTPEGYNSTDPRVGDTDGDGVGDGSEYYGFFYEQSNLWCYYTVQMDYLCDGDKGEVANATYLSLANIDAGTDPTNPDSDGDGMPDGWEINIADGLAIPSRVATTGALTRFVQRMRELGCRRRRSAKPVRIPVVCRSFDGAERGSVRRLRRNPGGGRIVGRRRPEPHRFRRRYPPRRLGVQGPVLMGPLCLGVNPLNGSDAFENPDGDGYDVNHDGVLSADEAFVNYLKYHIRSDLFSGNQTLDGVASRNFTTKLFDNIADFGVPTTRLPTGPPVRSPPASRLQRGAADLLSADTDDDGMPDGWEVWFSQLEPAR